MQKVVVQTFSERDKDWFSQVPVGTRLEVQFLDHFDSRFHSEMVGYRFGRYLIIRFEDINFPQKDGVAGMVAICRFLIEDSLGECFAFKTEIVNMMRRPDRLLFLNFPKEIHRRALRDKKRESANVIATIQMLSEQGLRGKPFSGLVQDISAGGCRFQFEECHTGRKVNLLPVVITLLGKDGEVDKEVFGKVRNSRYQDNLLSVGIQFDELQ
ncbi:PilZ domain-containing protein [Lacimicrobium alkaliphilum]|uniref:PilZ domain-containing protein n=1 Tax=Lacimicrobium alkaliphilum TaxID=1526571 RepID=A0ABQ1R4D4_9ALTE|nr:PilZ domain-containing protein [Lacimicrobium alkaliphilum]GGD55627.1 hypothetical protein GCM10011357_09050 [Lacimicrobium alkaliphilum]